MLSCFHFEVGCSISNLNTVIIAERHTERPIVYFDGACNLCSAIIRLIDKLDLKHRINLIPFQVVTNKSELNHIIWVKDGESFVAGKALIKILLMSAYPIKLLGHLLNVLPLNLVDKVYYLIVNNRYKWFGSKSCNLT